MTLTEEQKYLIASKQVEKLREWFTPAELREWFSSAELRTWFTPAELREWFNPAELRMWFSLDELRTWFSPAELRMWFTPAELRMWFSLAELRKWFNPAELREWLSPAELRTWFSLAELREWFSPAELRTWFTPAELRAWFSLDDILDFYKVAKSDVPIIDKPYTKILGLVETNGFDQETFGDWEMVDEKYVCGTPMCTAGNWMVIGGDKAWSLWERLGKDYALVAELMHYAAHPGMPCQNFGIIQDDYALSYIRYMAKVEGMS